MKTKSLTPYEEFYNLSSSYDKELLDSFFADLSSRLILNKKDKYDIILDFKKVIVYYSKKNYPVDKIIEIIDLKRIGGFYARDTEMYFPLDDGAKIFPLAMHHGKMSVFRLAVYLKTDVVPEILQIALTYTIKRFPSFATTLKNGFFWHYLDISKRRFCIEEEKDIPCQPIKVSKSRSQTFRVLYYNNRISVEFFHVLTDGSGGMVFLKALLVEYMRLLGVNVISLDRSIDVSLPPISEEYENEFSNIKTNSKPSGFFDKRATQLNGKLSKNNPCRIIHFKMETRKVKELSKKYNCTITAYFLSLMMLASLASTDTLKKEFSIHVPVNMRKFYPSKTVRNFTMYCGVRMKVCDIKNEPLLFVKVNSNLKEKTSLEPMNSMIKATRNIIKFLRWIPLIIKRPITKIIYRFVTDDIFTTILSNLGEVMIPDEILPYIESMDFALGTSFYNRASCSAVSINNVTTFTITKHTLDPSFEEEMYRLLSLDGLDLVVEGSDIYED